MVKNVACFFTGGYTESNAMQLFLNKINPRIVLKQFCPNRTKKRKRQGIALDLNADVSGLTGDSLTRYIFQYLSNYPDEFQNIDAIIIEDDLDGKYKVEAEVNGHLVVTSQRTHDFDQHCSDVSSSIREKLGKDESFPIIQFYAAPEIETWLLADWDHSFGYVYGPQVLKVLTSEENSFFSTRYRSYVKNNILKEYQDMLENYGYFDGCYHKLSDELIESMNSFKVFLNHIETPRPILPLEHSLLTNKALYFSKRIHGEEMLRSINPNIVYQHCTVYFRDAYDSLHAL